MSTAKTFEELIVWQKAHTCVLMVYRLTAGFPREEIYGLTAQLRRASLSIPANIAEGFKRRGRLDKARFLNIAQGSADEMRYFLRVGQDLEYGQDEALLRMLEEVSKLLEAYRRSIVLSLPAAVRPVFFLLLSLWHFLDSASQIPTSTF
ncbi:MAG TPA: four helix bundle protein [Vicinamibacterales bacterium]|nr:four helix bundle protein [Vicinamibacterales bacterium]